MNQDEFSSTIINTKQFGPIVTLHYAPKKRTGLPMSVSIAPGKGSNLFSWTYGDNDIIYCDKKLLAKCGFTGNFILFPTPNRVKNFTYRWNDKDIVMKKRGKIVELHGLVFTEPWDYEKPKINKHSISLTCSISITKNSPLYEAFAFPCRLTVVYTLYSNSVCVEYTVKNNSNEALPFGFALHPYFNRLSGDNQTYIRVPAKHWMESPKDTLLPTGKLIDVAGKAYDIRKAAAVGKLALDHVYTGLTPHAFASIDYRTKHFRVDLITSKEFTHAVVYTGEPHAVCIENQTCSTDAHNLWAKGLKKESHLLVVSPGQSKTGFISYIIRPY